MDAELQELVSESRTGDRQAQEQLVLAVQNKVYYHCLKMLQNQDDALDASQDILISLLKDLPSLRDASAFWPWLNQIICRYCYRHHARRSRFFPLTDAFKQADPFRELDDQVIPDQILDTEENRRIVRELVDALPEVLRLCILMYYFDEMSVKDISAALEIPEGTVKSRLHHARKRLRKGAEAYAAQGIPLRGLFPLPFLWYFLQQEAASGGLSAAAAKTLTGSVMAAASGAAISGAAAAGGVKAALSALAGRRALALAGLALAAVVAGGTLLHRPEAPPPPSPPVVRQQDPAPAPEDPPPVVPDEPEPPAPPLPEPAPAPVVPEAPAPVRTTPLVHTAPEPDLPPEETPAPAAPQPTLPLDPPHVFISLPAEPLVPSPEADPKPEPEPDPEPERPPVYIPPSRPEPSPSPEQPDPGPEQPDPPPEEPDQPEPVVYERTFADALNNGGYGYTARFAQAWGDYLPPVKMTYSSSDPAVVAVNEAGMFTTLAPGTAVVSALDENHDGAAFRYDLNVTVEDRFCWEYGLPDISVEEGKSELNFLTVYQWSRPEGYDIQLTAGEWTSGDPGVAEVTPVPNPGACQIRGVAPGTATVSGRVVFQLDTADGPKTMEDTLSFQVTVTEPPKPENPQPPVPEEPEPPSPGEGKETVRKELSAFGLTSGYGYAGDFAEAWQEALPEGLTYTSSDPSVVYIDNQGAFCTMAPGEAVLTAADPGTPEREYALTVRVQDCFQWEYAALPENAYLVCGVTYCLTGLGWLSNLRSASIEWTSSDPDIASPDPQYFLPNWYYCRVVGHALGTATFTGVVTFQVETPAGVVDMRDTVTFQVTVVE